MKEFKYYLVADRKLYRRSLEEVAAQAEEAGVSYFQLREKDLRSDQLVDLAKRIRARLRRMKFIVNGRTDVAIAAGADGVHLQAGNLPIRSVRAAVPHLTIGYSAHSLEEMRAAEAGGADYVFLSPVFPLRSKKSFLKPLGMESFIAWSAEMRIPVFALGGVSSENLVALQQSGCKGAAAISLFIEDGEFSSKQMVSQC